MFKKLRNKLLIVNMLIITLLLLGSFSTIYVVTAQNINRGINQKLERAINFDRSDRMQHQRDINPSEDIPPAEKKENSRNNDNPPQPPQEIPDNTEGKQAFSLTFTVTTDTDGNIVKKDIPFELDEDFYSDNVKNLIYGAEDKGKLKSESSYWAYKIQPLETGYIVVFTDIQAEHSMMFNLFIVLLLVALVALTGAFLISLFSANRSIRPVEESYNKQKQFVADASHELKTPLTTINTNIDVLLSHEDSKIRDERKWLDYIKTESERMTKLTNDLLYLARLDHNENNVMLSRVSFSEAAESVILLMEAVIFEKNINLDYDISPDIFVNGSSEQLKQLVMILLDNAVKYTQESGNIKISLTCESSDAVFTIRNSGEGISQEAQKQIFERFYREDKSRARESGGYGLGLAIANAIVTSCRGSICVNSQKNEYTEFIVKIPAVK